jgi:hypothetical protein
VPLLSAETATGNRALRALPSALEIITDGMVMVHSLHECETRREEITRKEFIPAVSAHCEHTTIYVVDHNGSCCALKLCIANLVSKRAAAAVDDCDFPAEFWRCAGLTLCGVRAAGHSLPCEQREYTLYGYVLFISTHGGKIPENNMLPGGLKAEGAASTSPTPVIVTRANSPASTASCRS